MSLAVALLLGVLTAQPDGGLALRGGEPAPAGRVLEVSLDGVTVGSTVASPVIVGWHRVRSVEGPLAGEAAAFEEVADDAWRAMSRLDRGDAQAAEPVFERLQDLYRGRSGPTAAAVFEGLLRCRLRRNAQTLAVDAWLEWRRARSAADGAQWYRGNRDAEGIGGIVFDEETGLVPDLPPLWLDVPAVRVFAEAPERTESVNERDRKLAALYRFAAGIAVGRSSPLPAPPSEPAARLVWDIVAAQSHTRTDREAGRQAIEARLGRTPAGWTTAWLLAAKGRSLLLEEELDSRQRGVIQLLTVYVRHEADSPYLAGLALAEAAVGQLDMGDSAGAESLRREFLDRFPGHPAASWERIMDWPPAQPAGRRSVRTGTD